MISIPNKKEGAPLRQELFDFMAKHEDIRRSLNTEGMNPQQVEDICGEVEGLLKKSAEKVKSRESAWVSIFSPMGTATGDFIKDEMKEICAYLEDVYISIDSRSDEQREYDAFTVKIFEVLYKECDLLNEAQVKIPEEILGGDLMEKSIMMKADALKYQVENRPEENS